MRVHVTANDVRWGVQKDGCSCPVAIAVMRALDEEYVFVAIDKLFVYASEDDLFTIQYEECATHTFRLPDEAITAITRYDDTGVMEPFMFDMEEQVHA